MKALVLFVAIFACVASGCYTEIVVRSNVKPLRCYRPGNYGWYYGNYYWYRATPRGLYGQWRFNSQRDHTWVSQDHKPVPQKTPRGNSRLRNQDGGRRR